MVDLLKKGITFSIVFLMLFGMVPWGDIISYAAYDADKFYVDNIAITKIYEDGGYTVSQTKLTIFGRYLQGIDVSNFTEEGLVPLGNRTSDTDSTQEFNIDGDIIGDIRVGGIHIPLEQNEFPTLSGVSKRHVIQGKDALELRGSNLKNIYDHKDEYEVYYNNQSSPTFIADDHFNTVTNAVYIPAGELKGTPGLQKIVISKDKKEYIDFSNNNAKKIAVGQPNEGKNEVAVKIQHTYKDQFSLFQSIDAENLIMNPNRGIPGDTIIFTATKGLDKNRDVFFLEKLTDKFVNENKGVNTQYVEKENEPQKLITQVPPNLKPMDYYVVLTNKIKDGEDPNEKITQMLVLGKFPYYDKFTVIDGKQKMRIDTVSPDKGPDSGSKVEIIGSYFGTLNLPDFIPNSDKKDVHMYKKTDGSDDETVMEIEYSEADDNGFIGSYNGIRVQWAKRTIKVIIGGVAKFAKKSDDSGYEYSFSDSIDKISMITQSITDADEDPTKDVIVESETVLRLEDVPNNVVIKDRAELKDGYTFIRSKLMPNIKSMTPEKIQVVQKSNIPPSYKIGGDYDRLVAIYGENFFVHKYIDQSGTEVIRYPIIEFGNGIRLNKNETGTGSNPNLDLKVFNKQGQEVDGSESNELGSKILVYIPQETDMETIGKTSVKIINPIRNSIEEGLDQTKADAVEFVVPNEVKMPIIQEVAPNIVTVNGGEEVEIIGSNFQDDAKVFIDGNEVSGIKLQGDGRKITFTAPPGREGETQIQVMNPEGGLAIHPFRYVKTYTDPKLTDFSPKSGKTDTLVVVTGQNFLKPDPTATKNDMYKLIGTRIFLEGKEINEYNKNQTTKKIELQPYTAPVGLEILKIIDNKLKLQDYYHSVILEDNNERHYTLDKNMKEEIILSNGVDEQYSIKVLENRIKGEKDGGNTYTVAVKANGITLTNDSNSSDQIELTMKTPFKVENNVIVGDRVEVVDINKLYFTVPKLPGDGYYDVTIVNPDTKKDSRTDNQGFYYYTQPSSRPNIESIDPDEGSVDGGYTITINGKRIDGRECFIDNGNDKTKVFIDGKLIPKEVIEVSIDGLSMKVKVPELGIDIKEVYNTDRLEVAVVVVNPDGGSASKEDGFTYIVPISHPEINKITPEKGTAAGGNYVEITGEDFRFYEPYDDDNRDGSWQGDEDYQNLNNCKVKIDVDEITDSSGETIIIDKGTEGPDDFTGQNVEALKKEYNKEKYNQYNNYDGIVLPVLPKVYFGDQQAEVVEFGNGYLKVIAPRNEAGAVDVYVKNNDLGISNKKTYTYEGSSPKITSISPDGGKKQGGDRVEVHGQDFHKSDNTVYYKDGGSYKTKTISQTLVRFGAITNKNIAREEENSGRIDNSRTTVRLDGGLTVNYDGINDTLNLNIIENQQNYAVTLPYEDNIVYVPVSILSYTDSEGESLSYVNATRGDEWIRFEVSDRRLFVERGYAPVVEYVNSGQLVVHTPSYYTVGQVPVTVINPDSGEASSNFEYKNPDSKPKITNITKDGKNPSLETVDGKEMKILRMSYKGGNMVSVLGSDFRENATIQIGDILSIDSGKITYQLPNKMTFEMPAVGEENIGKFFRVIVSNEDFGNAVSDELTPPIYIQFTKGETGPAIEEITPNKGPASGGNTVTIKGKDFREGLSILIGDMIVPTENVTVVDYKTITVKMPAHIPGKFELKIENPDGELSDPSGEYTYLSAPTIVSIVDPNDPTEANIISSISVEGGEEIKIKGSGFVEGARVVFSPSIEKSSEEGKEKIYINGEEWNLLEGTDGSDVRFIDEGTLVVKTPAGKLDNIGIMVINPDSGATKVYEGIKYGLPELPVPTGVTAELVYDRYIKVNWTKVEDAEEYEIHVVINDHEKVFVGSTELTSLVYKNLDRNTKYKFVVTAIGKYGGSKYSEESNEVRTGDKVGPKDEDGELGEKTKIEKVGNAANVIIGEDDSEKALDIDLTRGNLAGAKEVIISIPASVAANYDAKDVTVTGQDFRLKFNPKNFYSTQTSENRNKRDAGVRFSIKRDGRTVDTHMGSNGQTTLSKQYELKAYVYDGQTKTEMSYLPAYMQIALDVDTQKASMRRIKHITLSFYDEDDQAWIPIANGSSESYSIMGVTEKTGKFAVLGSRR